jgi:hypothetical protein
MIYIIFLQKRMTDQIRRQQLFFHMVIMIVSLGINLMTKKQNLF